MKCEVCNWCREANTYYCNVCGAFSNVQPVYYNEEEKEDLNETNGNVESMDDSEEESQTDKKCKHVWECLRDRCHNRGKGKYQAYKCKLCGKFQRR